MKNRVLTFIAVGFMFVSFAQDVSIPDANFKNYLLYHDGINTNFDDEIQVSEAIAFTDSIICPGLQIHDLTGIEAFENITFLSCVNNQLTSLDVSQNYALQDLICAMNGLTSLDVSYNSNLKNLRCSMNPIQSLNLINNPDLKYLYCENASLSSINLSQNTQLLELFLTSNAIGSLDLSAQAQLKRLDCSSNPLMQLDLAPNNALEYIMCNGNQLPSIALDQCPSLVHFRGVNNTFTQLDLSNCPNLEKFDCPFTQLTSLDFSHNPLLEIVYCFSSHLTSLNLANGNNPNLQLVWVSGNQLNCIKVDDVNYSTTNWTTGDFAFDAGTYFSVQCLAALSENEADVIELYPNPANDIVTINLTKATDYKLTSISGSVIQSGTFEVGEHSFDLDQLSKGTYFFEFETSGQVPLVKKLEKL